MLELGKLIVAFELPFAAYLAAIGFAHGTKRLFYRYKRFTVRDLLIVTTVLGVILGAITLLVHR